MSLSPSTSFPNTLFLVLVLLELVSPTLKSQSKPQSQYRSQSPYQENSDNLIFKQPKCIDDSNFFPDGDIGILNEDLNRWCDGRNCHICPSA